MDLLNLLKRNENEERPFNVYIEIDENKYITKIFSDCFEMPNGKSILIDKGFGDKFAHAQNNYFELPLIDENGEYNYQYIENLILPVK